MANFPRFHGVPQDSILGPLFLIYINDLSNCLQHSTARMFADDTNITVSGKSIEELRWSLMLIPIISEKTEYILIGSRHLINTLEEQPRVFIGDEPIKGVQVTKALVVWNKCYEKDKRFH
jgi:hypothetical protein